ncbi:transporter substrate-binding domain-containing protein [Undibacterium sp. TS12]|uniref:substrate-binding periplasmic protein n=1 Tax=Undibacterium sp. TS12 TaxID=2908202 RepID=UPI001F4CB54E|nr:transporter substrate-binding domain-containing protein [Undibacterium sp. TS12]MCH8617921.1 transporter substrate-binding domain-containing protein [Undibacterium sp. TS12]
MRILIKQYVFVLLFLGLTSLFPDAQAACSRTVNAPVASLGFSVIVNGDNITGIYPEIFRSISSKDTCQFYFTPVPRARLELMFENGQADMLFPAIRTAKRDEHGAFVPLIYTRATLISIQSARPDIHNQQELFEQRNLKLAVVRGYDYGEAYQAILAEFNKQGRLIQEADAVSVARVLKSGFADLTIMAPYIFSGAVQGDARVVDLNDKLRFEALAEIPWSDSGVYLSKKSLSQEDRNTLQEMIERAARSGAVWKGFLRYYKPEVLKEGSRPREVK